MRIHSKPPVSVTFASKTITWVLVALSMAAEYSQAAAQRPQLAANKSNAPLDMAALRSNLIGVREDLQQLLNRLQVQGRTLTGKEQSEIDNHKAALAKLDEAILLLKL